jgi:hypothetical protein
MALLAVIVLVNEEGNIQSQQQLHILEEVDPDEPLNLEASISGIEPASGPFRGGNKVVISGTGLLAGGLADVRQVLVGGSTVQRVVSASPERIEVVLGKRSARIHNPGAAAVAIVSKTKGQTVADSLYTFHAPSRIVAVRPDNGPHEGGNEVVVRGRHLTAGEGDKTVVLIDGEPCETLHQGKHEIRVKVPRRLHSSRVHAALVEVQSAAMGKAKLRKSYTYNPAPVITHVTPREGPLEGGNKLRIHGDMLTSGEGRTHEKVSVKLDGVEAEVLSFSPNSVLVVTPARKKQGGLVTITVTSSRHGSSKKPKAYRYHASPTITSLKPATGAADGGTHVMIRGQHLGKGDVSHVYFGNRRARVLSSSEDGTEVLVQTRQFSEADEGEALAVRIESATHGVVERKNAYAVGPRGQITGVHPLEGPCEGGTTITVSGQAFSAEGSMLQATVAGSPAKVLSHTDTEALLQTKACPSGAAKGIIELSSTSMGKVTTPYSIKYEYNALPVAHRLTPSMGPYEGGTQVLLRGERLCHGDCSDLKSVRVGNAVITEFISKSPRRVIFTSPPASKAGRPGETTVVLHSAKYGRLVVPRGYTIAALGAQGAVHPANIPLQGGHTITIEAPGLGITGEATTFGVELAGVPAKVLSASATQIVVAAGDATKSKVWHPELAGTGISGDIVVTATVNGKTFAKDLGLLFRYNPSCSIEAVAVRPGAHGGELAVLIAGANMGYGDEHIIIDGAPAKIHRRERHAGNVYRHHATVPHTTSAVQLVELESQRAGKCKWELPTPSTVSTSKAATPVELKTEDSGQGFDKAITEHNVDKF